MKRRLIPPATLCVLAAAATSCGAAPLRLSELDEVERVRATSAVVEIAQRAPLAYARAERARDEARRAHAAGDDIAAELEAERALTGYEEARAVARLAHAVSEQADAERALEDATAADQALEATRDKLERDRDALEKRVQVERDKLLPAPSPGTSNERELARRIAAGSMITEARLLCRAARLMSAEGHGLAEADAKVAELSKRLESVDKAAPKTRVPLDDVALARVGCLSALTRARRDAPDSEAHADALLAELSAAGAWDPNWDERGIVVLVRDAFAREELTEAGAAKLRDLGRVAAAHPGLGLQVVVHDAEAPTDGEKADGKRAEAAVRALVSGGAEGTRIDAELAAARLPIADPNDPKSRTRNERLEVVFVGK